jgi:hypothetical protein
MKEVKALTTEVAEHAKARMAKISRPRVQGNGPVSHASRKAKTGKGVFSKKISAVSACSAVIFFP